MDVDKCEFNSYVMQKLRDPVVVKVRSGVRVGCCSTSPPEQSRRETREEGKAEKRALFQRLSLPEITHLRPTMCVYVCIYAHMSIKIPPCARMCRLQPIFVFQR